MISNPTKTILRMLITELSDSHSRYYPTLFRMEIGERQMLEHDLAMLTSAAPSPPASTELVKFEAPDWEYMTIKTYPTNEAPAVRRLKVPGGYLYQVAFQDPTGKWHPPTFVPGDAFTPVHPKGSLEAIMEAARRV